MKIKWVLTSASRGSSTAYLVVLSSAAVGILWSDSVERHSNAQHKDIFIHRLGIISMITYGKQLAGVHIVGQTCHVARGEASKSNLQHKLLLIVVSTQMFNSCFLVHACAVPTT